MTPKSVTVTDESPEAHWLKADSFKAFWGERARYVASLVRDGAVICDIGCGQQDLRKYLSPNTIYLPADLKQWTEDTELCDLNAGIFPMESLARCDTCSMLGVISYINDPRAVFDEVARHVEKLIFTYNVTDYSDFQHPLWVNAYSLADLNAMISAAGYKNVEVSEFNKAAIFVCS